MPGPGGIPESISSNNLLPHKPGYEVDKPYGNDPDETRTVEMAITLMQNISFLLCLGGRVSPSQQGSQLWLDAIFVFEARPDGVVFTGIRKEFFIGLIACKRKIERTSAVRAQETAEVIAMVSTLPDPEQGGSSMQGQG